MLDSIVRDAASFLGVPKETALKLVAFIDLQKIMGNVGGMASSKFADYLGFLRLPDNTITQQFFASRWEDHLVRIDVPKEYLKYLSGDVPLFTPSRLEPQYNPVPFYEAGLEKTLLGVNTNPHDHGTVRKPKPMREEYENFIIQQFVPQRFFLELPNESIATVLSQGLPEVTFENPYPLHITVEEARTGLNKHLHNLNHRIVTKADLMRHTLIEINTEKLEINSDVFYTRNDLAAGSSSTGGFFYIGKIPAKAISVSDENIT